MRFGTESFMNDAGKLSSVSLSQACLSSGTWFVTLMQCCSWASERLQLLDKNVRGYHKRPRLLDWQARLRANQTARTPIKIHAHNAMTCQKCHHSVRTPVAAHAWPLKGDVPSLTQALISYQFKSRPDKPKQSPVGLNLLPRTCVPSV